MAQACCDTNRENRGLLWATAAETRPPDNTSVEDSASMELENLFGLPGNGYSVPTLLQGAALELAEGWTLDPLTLAGVLAPSRLGIYINGERVAVHRTRLDRFGERHEHLDRQRLDEAIASGCTVVLQEVRPILPEVEHLANRLELATGCRVWVNVFVAYGNNGLTPHWDDNNVVVCQVTGSRAWTVSDPLVPFPVAQSQQVAEHGTKVQDFVLEPGDVLAVPRGYVHSARMREHGAPSVHVMLAHRCPNGVDLIRWLAEAAPTREVARYDIPSDDQSRGEWMEALFSELRDLARSGIQEIEWTKGNRAD